MIWVILMIVLPIALTICWGIIEDWWYDFGDILLCWLLCQFLSILGIGMLGCFIIDGFLLDECSNLTHIEEEYRYELEPFANGQYFTVDEDRSEYTFMIYEDTKGYLTKSISSSQVYFVEIEDNETPSLVSYHSAYDSDKLDQLFINWHSHYTFYIPNLP